MNHKAITMSSHTRRSLLALLALPVLLLSGPVLAKPEALRRSVVKVFTTLQRPNFYEPWRMGSEENVSGSGCVLPGQRILTNAHVVSDQVFVQVLKDGDTQKYTAKVLAVAHDCDLALLKVDDPKFFKGTKPVTFGATPALRDKVSVFGYPTGGEVLSITEGVVSRIEFVTYSHSLRTLLGIQIDAAINPGNSGGPVFNSRTKRMVGVAFQGFNAAVAQNTGYVIPTLLVQRFLKEVKAGGYRGIPTLGLYVEPMESASLRGYYRMKEGQTGVLATKVVYGATAGAGVLENDVLLAIDGYPIANDGTIPFRKGERLNFQYPLCLHHIGDKLKLKVLRKGKPKTLSLTLKGDTRLVPYPRYDRKPSYFIFDGLVFTELDSDVFRASKSQDPQFLELYYSGLPSKDRKRVVLLSHIIPHEINKGYGADYSNLIVSRVNGRPLSGLGDLIPAFAHPLEGRHILDLSRTKDQGDKIVLKAEGSEKATQEILDQNNIPSDRSKDLREAKK